MGEKKKLFYVALTGALLFGIMKAISKAANHTQAEDGDEVGDVKGDEHVKGDDDDVKDDVADGGDVSPVVTRIRLPEEMMMKGSIDKLRCTGQEPDLPVFHPGNPREFSEDQQEERYDAFRRMVINSFEHVPDDVIADELIRRYREALEALYSQRLLERRGPVMFDQLSRCLRNTENNILLLIEDMETSGQETADIRETYLRIRESLTRAGVIRPLELFNAFPDSRSQADLIHHFQRVLDAIRSLTRRLQMLSDLRNQTLSLV